MGAVFVSHATDDDQRARELRERLADHGIRSVFLAVHESQGMQPGARWEQKLYAKLRSCRALVALNSRAYAASKWCFTEVAQAKALNIPVFPARIDDSDIHELIRDRQAVDLTGHAAEVLEAYRRLARSLQDVGVADGGWDPRERPPYPGLSAFEAEDAPVFFGREAAIAEVGGLLDLARAQGKSWLLLIGASGSGKSSLLRAGVLPQLQARGSSWIQLGPLIPGADPLQQLALAVSGRFGVLGIDRDWKACRSILESSDPRDLSNLAGDLRAAAGRPHAVVLVAVDQLEESLPLTTEDSSPHSEPAPFVRLLRALADHPSRSFMVVATLRADFLGEFQNHPALRGVTPQKYVIDPIGIRDLREVIERPAQLAGVAFEAGLVDEIIRETETADALPLLAFALRELYDGYSDDDLLELAEYRKLGGLSNSVAVAASRVSAV